MEGAIVASVEQYIALSSLGYADLTGVILDDSANLVGQFIQDRGILDMSKPELAALSSMGDWKLLAHQPNTPTGFAAAAFQSPEGQIIFAFRGTEPTLPSSPIKAIHAFLIKRLVSMYTLAV